MVTSKKACSSKLFAGGLTLLACSVAGALHAQEATDASGAKTLDAVVVTGTNIRGAEPVGNTVQVLGAEEIKATGRATVADFLRELPANFAGGVGTADNVVSGQDGAAANGNISGGQGVNLRGLGALSTLVLVNGRRVAASGLYGDFVDIANIPMAAIDRVEVLLDGASAVYGSDAVGGVVNLILKRRDDGASTSLRFGTTTEGGGTQYQLSQTFGTSWEDGGVLLGYEYNRQDRVKASDRNRVFNGADFSDRGGVNWQWAANRYAPYANLFSGAAAPNGNVIWRVPGGSGVGLTQADLIPVTDGAGNTTNPYANYDILPRNERHSLFASFEQDVNDRFSLYGDVRYTHRSADYEQGTGTVFGSLAPTNPYYIPGVVNNFGVEIDEFNSVRKVGVDSFAANLGGLIRFSDNWRGEVALSWSREEQQRDARALRDTNIGDRLSTGTSAPSPLACSLLGLNGANIGGIAAPTPAQQYCAGLNYEAFNPYTTQPYSQQVLNQLFGREFLELASSLGQASFKVDGDLAQLPGGALKVAVGADWRRERITGRLRSNVRSVRDIDMDVGMTERDVSAAFAEAALPIVGKDNAMRFLRAFDLSAAVRYESYSGLGKYETTNPKLGFSLKPADSLTLRGSWGTSFHAPPMRFMYNGPLPVSGGAPNDAFMSASAYMAPCNTTMVPVNGVVGTPGGTGNCSFTAIVVRGAAGPELKPEEAKTWTFGLDFRPESVPGLRIGVDYFNLKVDDRIVRIQGGTFPGILAQLFATGTSPYIGSLSLNPSVAEVEAILNGPKYTGQTGTGPMQTASDVALIAYATQSNLASLKMDGIDFQLGYGFDTERAGSFDLFVNGTSLIHYEVQAAPGSPYVSQLNQYSAWGNPVKLRTQQGIVWRKGDFQARLSANYVDSYECRAGCYVPNPATGMPMLATQPIKIDSWLTYDLGLDYDLSRFGGLFEGARIGFTAVNLANKEPPFIDGGTTAADAFPDAYDAANATVIGRTLALTIDKRW